jgi:hypothetical protein
LENFIGQYYLPDISVCDEIIDFFEINQEVSPGVCRSGEDILVDKTIKDCYQTVLKSTDNLYGAYTSSLQACCDSYIESFPFSNYYSPFTIVKPINIQKYLPGQAFNMFHSERTSSHPNDSSRHLVFMTYLNNVDDGGETEFYHQNLLIKPKKGLTLIWPADWTYTHRGLPSHTETKYIVTGWYEYI